MTAAVEGAILNKHMTDDVQIHDVAASTNIPNGRLCYQDGSNGLKLAPTDGSKAASLLRFVSVGADNSSGSKGDKKVESWKTRARVIGKCDGAIVVGTYAKTSNTSAHGGQFKQWTKPSNATSPTAGEVDAVRDAEQEKVARYLGHIDEGIETGNLPTDAADEDLGVFELL